MHPFLLKHTFIRVKADLSKYVNTLSGSRKHKNDKNDKIKYQLAMNQLLCQCNARPTLYH